MEKASLDISREEDLSEIVRNFAVLYEVPKKDLKKKKTDN